MCGICGIWGHPNPAKTDRMVAAMHHRGPDDSGVYVDSNISFGMTRLAVIDLNPTGHQPMSNSEQTLWIIFNGEISRKTWLYIWFHVRYGSDPAYV